MSLYLSHLDVSGCTCMYTHTSCRLTACNFVIKRSRSASPKFFFLHIFGIQWQTASNCSNQQFAQMFAMQHLWPPGDRFQSARVGHRVGGSLSPTLLWGSALLRNISNATTTAVRRDPGLVYSSINALHESNRQREIVLKKTRFISTSVSPSKAALVVLWFPFSYAIAKRLNIHTAKQKHVYMLRNNTESCLVISFSLNINNKLL